MRNRLFSSVPFRIFFALAVPAALFAGAAYLFRHGSPFFCVTYKLFGIYCPGCGAGRAAYALLHLRPLLALDYNVMLVLFLPFLAYYFLKQYIKIVFGRDPLPMPGLSYKACTALILSIILFWILRNIPVFPFTVLAP